MFSFPRPDVVQTGTPGYAYLFDTASGESYIYLQSVFCGSQSAVNLVANTDTSEPVIQKILDNDLPPNPLIEGELGRVEKKSNKNNILEKIGFDRVTIQ